MIKLTALVNNSFRVDDYNHGIFVTMGGFNDNTTAQKTIKYASKTPAPLTYTHGQTYSSIDLQFFICQDVRAFGFLWSFTTSVPLFIHTGVGGIYVEEWIVGKQYEINTMEYGAITSNDFLTPVLSLRSMDGYRNVRMRIDDKLKSGPPKITTATELNLEQSAMGVYVDDKYYPPGSSAFPVGAGPYISPPGTPMSKSIKILAPELYFTSSDTTENILHVPATSSQGTVITGDSSGVSIPVSALLEVAQATPPPEITVKYTGTSVPTVTDKPVTRSRKRVK